MGHDIFISYSSKDKTTADTVCAVLEQGGVRCWVAPRDILPGADWGESIIDAINGARVFVLIFSQHANASPQIRREVERAVHKGIPVIPFRIEDVLPAKALEYFLSTPHWLDAFTPPVERHVNYLGSTIKKLLSVTPETDAPLPPRPAPQPAFAPQKWQIGAGAALVAVLAAWYFLAPSGTPRPAAPVAPSPATAPAQASAQPSFVGKWQAEKVTISEGAMAPLLDSIALGDMLRAAYSGPDVSAEFDVTNLGQYHFTYTAEDHGTVAGDRAHVMFKSALNGRTALVQLQPVAAQYASSMANIGAQPGDSGLVVNMQGRGQMMWFGNPQGSASGAMPAAFVGRWHNKTMMAPGQSSTWTGELDITADGKYRLKVTQLENGLFQAQDGQWTRTPDTGAPVRGNYVFDGKDRVTAASNTGSIVWKRVN